MSHATVTRLLENRVEVEDRLRHGDAHEHVNVVTLLGQLDADAVMDLSRELRRLYRWLDADERSRLVSRCVIWAAFE